MYATPLHREPVFAEFAGRAAARRRGRVRPADLPARSLRHDRGGGGAGRPRPAHRAGPDGPVTARGPSTGPSSSPDPSERVTTCWPRRAPPPSRPGAWSAEIVDAMRMLGQGPGAVGDWVFRRLLSVNAVYDAFHFSQLRDDGRLARAHGPAGGGLDVPPPAGGRGPLRSGAGGLGLRHRRRRGRPGSKPSGLSGDVGRRHDRLLRPPVLGARVDRPVPGDLGRRRRIGPALLAGGQRRGHHRPGPAPSSTRRRRRGRPGIELGVPQDATCVLLMSGAWGLGPLDGAAAELAAGGTLGAGGGGGERGDGTQAARRWPGGRPA